MLLNENIEARIFYTTDLLSNKTTWNLDIIDLKINKILNSLTGFDSESDALMALENIKCGLGEIYLND